MKQLRFFLFMIIFSISFIGCFSEKNSQFYDSEWIMSNEDKNYDIYYHHLILQPDHKAILRTSYMDSSNIMVWKGTYKINSKKIIFNYESCSRYENGEIVGEYNDKRLIKFYSGEYFYSQGLIGESEEEKRYHLQLIHPKTQIYGETKDIYGNYFEDFIKIK